MVYSSESLFGRADAPKIFLLRRLARIAPLYWAVTIVIIAYIYAAHGAKLWEIYSPASLVASFLFWPYPRLDGMAFPVHLLGWTLNYEMFFYAVFAVAILLPRRFAVPVVTIVFIALVLLGRAVALPLPFAFWANSIIWEFCLGMLIATAYREGVRLPPAAAWALGMAALPWICGDAGFACRLGRVAGVVLGPAERRAGRGLRAVVGDMAARTGRGASSGCSATGRIRSIWCTRWRFRWCAGPSCAGSTSRPCRGFTRRRCSSRRSLHRSPAISASSGRSRARCGAASKARGTRGAREAGQGRRRENHLRRHDQRRNDEQWAEREPGQLRERTCEQRHQQDRGAGDLRQRARIVAHQPRHDERADHEVVVLQVGRRAQCAEHHRGIARRRGRILEPCPGDQRCRQPAAASVCAA